MIQEKLTEMEIRVQNTRNMLYKVLWELDNDIPVQLDSALLKRYGCTECFNVADMALAIYGGLGYTTEVRIGRLWADMATATCSAAVRPRSWRTSPAAGGKEVRPISQSLLLAGGAA